MKGYTSRWISDVTSFTKAYLLALVGILPLTLQTAPYGLFVYLALLPYGLLNIVVFGLGTAVSRNYLIKLSIFIMAIAVNAYMWIAEPLISSVYSWDWLRGYAVLLAQILVLFVLFYGLLERAKIAAWIGMQFDAVEKG
jgi:hypothetical protein